MRAEAVLRALGISDGASFDSLLEALSADSNIELRAKGMVAQPGRMAGEGALWKMQKTLKTRDGRFQRDRGTRLLPGP